VVANFILSASFHLEIIPDRFHYIKFPISLQGIPPIFFGIFFVKRLDKQESFVYNNKVFIWKRTDCTARDTPVHSRKKEVQVNGQNLPAQEETEKDGARLPQENGYCEWQKGPEEKTR
jgi:hypothetical protein